jgi:hypothetical protein
VDNHEQRKQTKEREAPHMNKKIIGFLLALVMVSVSAMAFATAVPSKTTQDMVKPVGVTVQAGASTAIQVSTPADEAATALATKVLGEISSYVQQQANPVINYFDQGVQEQVAALLPAGTNLSTINMNEFTTIKIDGYSEENGDLTASFEFATKYEDGQAIVAMVGVEVDGTMTWTALKAEVVDGIVKITFPEAVVKLMQTGNAVLSILSV